MELSSDQKETIRQRVIQIIADDVDCKEPSIAAEIYLLKSTTVDPRTVALQSIGESALRLPALYKPLNLLVKELCIGCMVAPSDMDPCKTVQDILDLVFDKIRACEPRDS